MFVHITCVYMYFFCMRKKEKIEILVDPATKEKLKAHAETIGGTMAGILKVALNEYLKKI